MLIINNKHQKNTSNSIQRIKVLISVFKLNIEFDHFKPCIFDEQIDLLLDLAKFLDSKESENQPSPLQSHGLMKLRGAMLIFVPGMFEINRLHERLRQIEAERKLVVCILHSEVALDVQMRVHQRAPDFFRKVIISTSIAESSITVPDVKYVVDFCLTKTTYTDTGTNLTQLLLDWAAKSNCDQRMGRAGRVNNGICFRMVPSSFYQNKIADFPTPAIERESLERLILKIKRYFPNRKAVEILSLALKYIEF